MANNSFPYDEIEKPLDLPFRQENGPVIIAGRYELQDIVGGGSMSRVYRARDKVLDRIVAIKLLREEYVGDQNSVARFYREARAIATLSAPNTVEVYDYGQFGDTFFIAMQYVEGTDLKQLLQEHHSFSIEQAIDIVNEVLLALAIAHQHGIIHRDVKPQNILIRNSDGAVKLTDFGIAHVSSDAPITTTGAVLGTAHYMSPEQANGDAIGPGTDLYAVGAVLYQLITGRLPFQGANQIQIMYQHLHEPPPTFASAGVRVPPELEKILQRALAKSPAQRFQSAEEMRKALSQVENMLTQPQVIAPNPRPVPATSLNRANPTSTVVPAPPNSRWVLPLLVGLLVGLGGIAWLALSLFSRNPDSRPSPTGLATVTPETRVAPTVAPTSDPNDGNRLVPTATIAIPPTVRPTEPPRPTVTPKPPTQAPVVNLPTVTPIPPGAPARPTTVAQPQPTLSSNNSISPYDLVGSYKRDDGMLYGREEVALYGTGSDYAEGKVTFKIDKLPGGNVSIVIIGLDDEREEHCVLQVVLNDVTIFNAPTTFPQVPNGDIGVGGSERYWGQMRISVPANALKTGTNTLVLRNTTPWAGYLGIPYILVSNIAFAVQ